MVLWHIHVAGSVADVATRRCSSVECARVAYAAESAAWATRDRLADEYAGECARFGARVARWRDYQAVHVDWHGYGQRESRVFAAVAVEE